MIPGSTSVSSSEQIAFGDTKSDTKGTASANIGLVNAIFGRGNSLTAAATASAAATPPWIWALVAAAVVGGAVFILMRKNK